MDNQDIDRSRGRPEGSGPGDSGNKPETAAAGASPQPAEDINKQASGFEAKDMDEREVSDDISSGVGSKEAKAEMPAKQKKAAENGAKTLDKGKKSKKKSSGKKKKSSAGSDLLLLVFKVIIVGLFLGFMYLFFFGITQVTDESMDPALREGDLVVYYRSDKNYQKDDLITVEVNGKMTARRVVAVAGDTVDINENGLMINGYSQIEKHIYTDTEPYTEGITFPVTIAEGQVFVLADSRPGSEDSRIYGPVDLNATGGRVITVIRRRNL